MPEIARRANGSERAAIGLIIMAFGVVVLLDRAGMIGEFGKISFWPVAVICVGLVKLANRWNDGRFDGAWWLFFGVLLLLEQLRVFRLRDSWPLILVAIGIGMAWRGVVRPRPRTHERVE
jgi:hypothetical protein